MDKKITAVQARQIAEANGANNAIVKLNVDYILKKVIKEANKGELHCYVSINELYGHNPSPIIFETFEVIRDLGYKTFNCCGMIKITW